MHTERVADALPPMEHGPHSRPALIERGADFRSTRQWANSAVTLLAVGVALDALLAGLLLVSTAAYWRFEAGLEGGADAQALLAALHTWSIVGIAAGVPGFLAMLFWIHRMMRNAPMLGTASSRYSPRLAVISWCIPIVNAYVPYRVVLDLGRRLAAPDEDRNADALIRTWWACALATMFLTMTVNFVMRGEPGTTLSTEYFVLRALMLAVAFAAAVLQIAVVLRVQSLADSRETGTETGRSDGLVSKPRRIRRFIPLGLAAVGTTLILVFAVATLTSRPAGPEWATFSPVRQGFSVSLPRIPSDVPSTIDTEAGPVSVHTYTSRLDGRQGFAVACMDFPAGSLSRFGLEAALDELVAESVGDNETMAKSAIHLGATPGRMVRIKTPAGDINEARYYVLGDSVYGLEADMTADRISSTDIGQFFDSFTLLDASK